jgi:hypothetical protein
LTARSPDDTCALKIDGALYATIGVGVRHRICGFSFLFQIDPTAPASNLFSSSLWRSEGGVSFLIDACAERIIANVPPPSKEASLPPSQEQHPTAFRQRRDYPLPPTQLPNPPTAQPQDDLPHPQGPIVSFDTVNRGGGGLSDSQKVPRRAVVVRGAAVRPRRRRKSDIPPVFRRLRHSLCRRVVL